MSVYFQCVALPIIHPVALAVICCILLYLLDREAAIYYSLESHIQPLVGNIISAYELLKL